MLIDKLSKAVGNRAAYMYPCKLKMAGKKDFLPLHNHRCQWNAYHAVKAGMAVSIVECVMINSDGTCTAHYINKLESGECVDYTLGYAWSSCDYRFVRIVDIEDWQMNTNLTNLKARLCDGMIPWWAKLFGVTPDKVC